MPVEAWSTGIDCAIDNHTGVVGSGLYIVGCDVGALVALDVQTGAEAWRADLGGPVEGSPAVADGVVYASDASGRVTATDLASGEQLASAEIPGMRHPVVVDGTVYVGTKDGRFLGLSPDDLSVTWTWQAPPGVEQVSGTVSGDAAFIGADDGNLYAISLADSTERWHFQVLSGAVSTPAIGDGTIYVSSLQTGETPSGELYALDLATGEEQWRYRTDTGNQIAPPTVADGTVYVPSQDGGLYAFDGGSGDVLWQAPTEPTDGQTPVIAGDLVYLAADRSLVAIARAGGAEAWSVDLGADIDSSPLVTGGVVIVGDNSGRVRGYAEPALVALLPSDPVRPTTAPEPPGKAPLELIATLTSNDFSFPNGIDAGPDGRLYVVNAFANEVLVLDGETGETIHRWGSNGSDEGQFNFIRDPNDPGSSIGGLEVSDDGLLYVTDTVNRRIQVFETGGEFVRQWGRFGSEDGQFLEPIDIAIGPDGDIFVVDDQRDDVQRFSPDGEFKNAFGGHGTEPGQMNFTSGIWVQSDGTVLNADWDNHRIQAFDTEGESLWTYGTVGTNPGQFQQPGDIATDSSGRIFVTDENRIVALSPEREFLGTMELEQFPGYMVVSGDALYVTCPWDSQILIFRVKD
jgi:outer membrane protein assembly factor BamB